MRQRRGHRDGEISEQKERRCAHRSCRRPPKVLTDATANVTEHDIARRAYDLYLARDHQHGHDLDDWLQAERELRDSRRSTHTKRP
jgi:hypothetical protein